MNATPPSANIGTILTVSGTMSTVNCEKVIINPSVSMDGSTIINPLGLSTKSLGGGDWFYDDQTGEGQQGVTDGVGLNNIGLLVKIWGKVTSVDSANKFFCLNDGSGSVKVSFDWEGEAPAKPIIPPNVGWTVSVSGISSIAADSARLLRVRSQGDIVLHDPQDTGDPTVAITSPAGTEWHKASGASHITISGTATDAETAVVSVQVRITGGNWEQAVYDPITYTWSYDWQNPTTGARYVYVKATDFTGNFTTISKYVRIADPIYWPMFHHDITLQGVTDDPIGSSLSDPDPANRLPKKWVAQLNGNSNTTQEHTWSSSVVANGVVYVGTNTGWLYAFDMTSGTQLAALNVGAPIHGTPCINNGVIYVGAEYGDTPSSPGRLYVYALQGGQFVEQWHYDCCGTDHATDSNQKIWGSISVYNGAVYFGSTYNASNFTYGWFHTVDLATHQDRSGSPVQMRYSAVGNTPGIDVDYASGPRAYLSDYSCYVAAVTCETGAAAWAFPGWGVDTASMYASPVAYQGYLFVGSNYSCLYRLADTGSTATYSRFAPSGISAVESTPAAYNGKIYFGCSNNNIYCVDALTLQQSSVINLGSPVVSSPAISSTSGLVFVASSVASQSSATIYALDANDITNERWSYNIYADHPGAYIKSSPAVVNGRMFIVAGDSSYRYLYCFGD